jgi:hypothetical protein
MKGIKEGERGAAYRNGYEVSKIKTALGKIEGYLPHVRNS